MENEDCQEETVDFCHDCGAPVVDNYMGYCDECVDKVYGN